MMMFCHANCGCDGNESDDDDNESDDDEFKPEGAVSGGPSKQGTLREPSVTISSVQDDSDDDVDDNDYNDDDPGCGWSSRTCGEPQSKTRGQ